MARTNSVRFKLVLIIFIVQTSKDSNLQVWGFFLWIYYLHYIQGELYWTHHWQKNFTIPDLGANKSTEKWVDQDKFPEDDDVSDTSSRLVINRIFSVLILKKELNLCRKLEFSNSYIIATWWNISLIFQT